MFRHADWITLWNTPVPFTQKQLREDIDALAKRYRALGFAGVRVTTDFSVQKSIDRAAKNVRIGIAINERKRIAVAFEGNASQSASTLQDQLTLFTRGSYDDYEVGASADAIQRHYQQQGNFFARVDWRRERLSADEERIVFSIDEGPVLQGAGCRVRRGARALAAGARRGGLGPALPLLGDRLGRLRHRQAARTGRRAPARALPRARVRRGEGARRRRHLAGRPRRAGRDRRRRRDRLARGRRPLRPVHHRRGAAARRWRAEDLRSTDGTPLPYEPALPARQPGAAPGRPLRAAHVAADAKRLVRLLGDAGYPLATVEPDVDRKGNDVTLTWKVTLGPRMRVGPIFVRGNFVTKPRTILEQIRLRPGDYLGTTPVERSQRDIGFLQLFNNASPISFPGRRTSARCRAAPTRPCRCWSRSRSATSSTGSCTSGPAPRPIRSRPTRRSRSASTCAAATTTATCSATAGRSTASSPTAPPSCAANVGFLDRRFLGTLFRFDASLTYLRQETVRLGDIHSGGGSIGFSREMYPGVDAGLHYNLRNTTHTEPLLRGAGPNENTQNVTLGTTVGSLSANVEWLRMDNRLLPTRGFRVDAIAELALPALSIPLRPFPFAIGDDTFLKVGVHSLSVIPLGKHLFLRHGFRYDQGFPLGGASLLPKVERYFAGGDTTIRGFQLDRARVEVESRGSQLAARRPLRRRVPPARRQPAHPAEHRPAVPHHPPLVRLGLHGQRRGGRLVRRASRSRSSATASASRRCSSGCRSATSASAGAGRSIPARATPGSASSTSTSA